MAAILTPQRWLTKPTGPVELDPRWLDLGFYAGFYGQSGPILDIWRSSFFTPVSGHLQPNTTANDDGVAKKFEGANGVENANISYLAPPLTLFWDVVKSTTVADCICSFGGAGSGNGWKIGSTPAGGSGTADDFYLTYGGVADYKFMDAYWLSSGRTCGALSISGANGRLFRGRSLIATTASLEAPNTPSKPFTIGAAWNGASYVDASNSTIGLLWLFRGALIDAVIASILAEPYAILRPRRPVLYYFKAAGGGITGTMAPTAANDTMAATGVIGIAGTMAPTAGADAMSADGAVASVGSMAASCGADAMAASGVVTDVGTMAATAANDTMGAVGFVGSITGTMAAQAGDDGMIASGTAGEDSGLVQSGMLANLGKLLGHR